MNQWANVLQKKEEEKNAAEKAKKERENEAKAMKDREIYESVDNIINVCIDEIWNEFDVDGNGDLDIDETHEFVKHTLVEMGETAHYS